MGGVCDDDPQVGAERQAQVVVGEEVRGIGDRDDHRAVLDADREGLVALGDALGQARRRFVVQRGLAQVDEVEPVLLGERFGQVARGDQPEGNQHLAERKTAPLLLRQRLLQPIRVQAAPPDEERAEEGTPLRVPLVGGRRQGLDGHGRSIGAAQARH